MDGTRSHAVRSKFQCERRCQPRHETCGKVPGVPVGRHAIALRSALAVGADGIHPVHDLGIAESGYGRLQFAKDVVGLRSCAGAVQLDWAKWFQSAPRGAMQSGPSNGRVGVLRRM